MFLILKPERLHTKGVAVDTSYGGGTFDWKWEVLVPFFKAKSDRSATSPMPSFPQMIPIKILR